jgi:hypothetical protein
MLYSIFHLLVILYLFLLFIKIKKTGMWWLSFRGCGGSVFGDVVAQFSGMWWLSWLRQLGHTSYKKKHHIKQKASYKTKSEQVRRHCSSKKQYKKNLKNPSHILSICTGGLPILWRRGYDVISAGKIFLLHFLIPKGHRWARNR